MTFFTPPREHFFRPLTHDNRQLCAAVLRQLHERVHGANADYAEALTRDVVLEVVLRSLADPSLRALAFEAGRSVPAEEERSYASDLLRKLKEHGWLEDYRDPIDLKPTLKLSRAGKAFSETFANPDDSRTKTRQRNMRSARKALAAFLATHDADELLDAHEFASRVVQDLQDDIEILASLREVFPNAQAWAPGYNALADILARGGGHLPAHAGKELQIDPGHTGCGHADNTLLPLMRQHGLFMDQEVFDLGAAA